MLAIDSGRVKALFTAHVLARHEADLGVNVVESFDLIAGASAGGIIASRPGPSGFRATKERLSRPPEPCECPGYLASRPGEVSSSPLLAGGRPMLGAGRRLTGSNKQPG